MNKTTLAGEVESSEELTSILLDEKHGSGGEVVGLETIIQIQTMKIKDENTMSSKQEGITKTNKDFIRGRILAIAVIDVDVLEDVAFDGSLFMELLFVLDDLECNRHSCLVVECLDDLTKTTFTKI